jgi:hypothetical protein
VQVGSKVERQEELSKKTKKVKNVEAEIILRT